ncbi:hypothetical protein OBBRIDRAFT_840229 [Obba rivulosa]|uniref:Uncharacterized protein n=1 Tax=Obba rivulosa TaxID=1052685 RepID=A0A8E2AKY3_9APHY|nr:hypothetical protein OBBRIDRAFT_840229 [Obba rivulosa]
MSMNTTLVSALVRDGVIYFLWETFSRPVSLALNDFPPRLLLTLNVAQIVVTVKNEGNNSVAFFVSLITSVLLFALHAKPLQNFKYIPRFRVDDVRL